MNTKAINSELPFGEFDPEKGINRTDMELKQAVDRFEDGRLEYTAEDGTFTLSVRGHTEELEISEKVAKYVFLLNADDRGYWFQVM